MAEARFSTVRDDVSARAALEMLERVNAAGFKDSELAFGLNFQAAMWAAGPLADEEAKIKFATEAKKIGTDDEGAMEQLAKLLG